MTPWYHNACQHRVRFDWRDLQGLNTLFLACSGLLSLCRFCQTRWCRRRRCMRYSPWWPNQSNVSMFSHIRFMYLVIYWIFYQSNISVLSTYARHQVSFHHLHTPFHFCPEQSITSKNKFEKTRDELTSSLSSALIISCSPLEFSIELRGLILMATNMLWSPWSFFKNFFA